MADTTKDIADAANASDLDTSPVATLPAATTISTSGAPVQIVPDVDMSHPAVDANPRANTTELMNKIDFNDPRPSAVIAAEKAAATSTKA